MPSMLESRQKSGWLPMASMGRVGRVGGVSALGVVVMGDILQLYRVIQHRYKVSLGL